MTRAGVYILLFYVFMTPIHGVASFLQPASFPKTIQDTTTFTERMENERIGFMPYKDKRAYDTLKIQTEQEYLDSMIQTANARNKQDLANMSVDEYCNKYPLDAERCPQTSGQEAQIIANANRKPTPQTIAQPTGTIVGYDTNGIAVIAKPNAYNGPCTQPQHSNWFSNKILSTGKYAGIDPAFEKAIITTFRKEGDCVNDPDDSGGYTCYGISQKNNPEIDVKNITRADAENIAYQKYYTQYGFNKLPDHIRGSVFMLGWNAGPVVSIRRLCRVLGIPERNEIDNDIINAIHNYPGDLHNDFMDVQQKFYIDASNKNNNKKYLKGWMESVRLTRENGCHTETTTPIRR